MAERRPVVMTGPQPGAHRWGEEERSVLSSAAGAEPRAHEGRYLALWRLDADGVWRIERYVDGIGGDGTLCYRTARSRNG